MAGLLDDETLSASAVVANIAMNRERQLAGPNSYTRDLGFNPLDRLLARLEDRATVAWLDLCCGQGRALLQAGAEVTARGLAGRVELVGVDLVDYFDPGDPAVTLVCAPATSWQPDRRFDLITVVHGLHYVGDKLGVLARAASWLTDTGQLVADLDLASIRGEDGAPLALGKELRRNGFTYDGRRHRISLVGRREPTFPYDYRGADDRAGPNYTGQPAVHSFYRKLSPNPSPLET
ncbi:methyltransferase [Asanoa ishikariensis]|uniref:Methyltransferase domain-containing protein n=1 Tax=Asanoa ishikariensis TaxID=137265 RepID=A0A1H3TYG0_9ACTN|nr:class I SAM-dependent methyltransferase [Asanoa ishikariensis]GIF67688.1 methyltransferase [Asanoa ishikariensis]SDZ55128.1 Methyltransferase domain-containing protein [Asanoa ishikariensis]